MSRVPGLSTQPHGRGAPLPPLFGEGLGLTATDDQLVAVVDQSGPVGRAGGTRWATWAPGDSDWTVRGEVPVAAQLEALDVQAPIVNAENSLVWTGERVLDVGRGAVLDPDGGAAEPLPLPDDLLGYAHLSAATPVWTGDQVNLASWAPSPGLVWDATGKRMPDIPAPPSCRSDVRDQRDSNRDGRSTRPGRQQRGQR